MKIKIENCNNIDSGEVEIEENKLNIKYAINGTGKTTVVKAIEYSINDKNESTNNLIDLKPFKYYNDNDISPCVSGIESINSIKIFNEKYIKSFVFQPDELVKGSFDIFVRNDIYERGLKEINELVFVIKKMFQENKEIDELVGVFNELIDSFGRPTKSGIHGSSNLSKAFKNGNKIVNIPLGLEEFGDYIQSEQNFKWIKWQLDGQHYLGISHNCPYCTSNIDKKADKIQSVSKVYDPKSIEYLNKIVGVFQKLNQYFTDDTVQKINEFIKCINGYTNEQVSFLVEIKEQIERLKDKLISSKNISFQTLKDVDKVINLLKDYKIDLGLYSHLNSKNTQDKVKVINASIDEILTKAGELQGKINIQKKLIEKTIEENKGEINNFLVNAGYKYRVDLIDDGKGEYKLKLVHIDIGQEIKEVDSYLSFGERNAFALVLFMFDALKSNPSLIILDDPISSFDKNKKYAIIDMLFRSEKSLRAKTVLLLTHDFDPILDMLYHHRSTFLLPNASFLENKKGVLTEKSILMEDIKTFIDITKENIKTLSEDVNKIIYLRRYYEINNDKGSVYQLLSNLIHKRETPINKLEDRDMHDTEIDEAANEIKNNWIENFNYNSLLAKVKDNNEMKEIYNKSANNYEKLQIYRIIFDDEKCTSVVQKFINETFHIENDYIYQLNPCKYQLVPQFVIDECNENICML